MFILVTFIVSLVLIASLLSIKSWEICTGKVFFLTRVLFKGDPWVLWFKSTLKKCKYNCNFNNLKFIFSWLISAIRQLILKIKRQFDHKQAHFFIKRDYDATKGQGSVSFFLKNVAEYKKSLRSEEESDIIKK